MDKLFLKEFLKNPRNVGAISPSSKKLSNLISTKANLGNKKSVVEIGSGLGNFTSLINEKISKDCTFFGIEINQKFFHKLTKKYPNITFYNDSAKNINKYLLENKLNACECIISGLPWSSFDTNLQKELLDSIYDNLEEGGTFLTFAYIQGGLLPRGIKFRNYIKSKFKEVKTSEIVWLNLPPAFIYICKK